MHSGGFGGAGGHKWSGETKCANGRKGAQKQSSEAWSHKRKEPCGPHKSSTPLKRNESITSEIQSSSESLSLTTDSQVWGSFSEGTVPTKKRTLLSRAHAPLEKVARHLLELLYEPPASNPFTTSCVSSEALLVEYNPPFADFEVGLGSIFLNRPPTSSHHEHGRETNSVWYESLEEGSEPFNALNQVAETRISGPLTQLPNGGAKNLLDGGKEKVKQITRKLEGESHLLMDRNITHNKSLLENFPYNKRDILQSSQSPLVFLEMKDIVNFETFTGLLTEEEQTWLMKFLSSVDLARFQDSLKEMFNSTQFEGVFANFQQLLSEGMFDSAESGLNPRILQHFQQLLNLTDLSGSGWLERCSQLQHRIKRRGKSADLSKAAQIKESSKENMKEVPAASMGSAGFKHSPAWLPSHTWGVTEEDLTSHTGSEKHKGLSGNHSPLSTDGALVYGGSALRKHPHCMKMDTHDSNHAGETCFLGNSLLLADRSRCGGGSISVDDIPDIQVPGSYGTESDLLFHIPSNMMSFQQAELLQQPTCKEEINSNQVENGSLIISNTWHMDSGPSD